VILNVNSRSSIRLRKATSS